MDLAKSWMLGYLLHKSLIDFQAGLIRNQPVSVYPVSELYYIIQVDPAGIEVV